MPLIPKLDCEVRAGTGADAGGHAADPAERRTLPRLTGQEISAFLRRKGSFNRLAVEVLDFNRHGAAIQLQTPLPREQVVFLTLRHGSTELKKIIGVVHNCLGLASGYRCGVRFRTGSALQLDRSLIERQLALLESQLAASS